MKVKNSSCSGVRMNEELNLHHGGRMTALDNSVISTQVIDPVDYNKVRDQSFEARARDIDMKHQLLSHSPYVTDEMYHKLANKYTGEAEARMPSLFVREIEFDKTCERIAKAACPLMVIPNELPVLLRESFNKTTAIIKDTERNVWAYAFAKGE